MNREYRITNIGIINDISIWSKDRRKKIELAQNSRKRGGRRRRNFLITIETTNEEEGRKIELAPSDICLVSPSRLVKIHREYVNHVFEHKSDWLNGFDARFAKRLRDFINHLNKLESNRALWSSLNISKILPSPVPFFFFFWNWCTIEKCRLLRNRWITTRLELN